MDIYNANRKKLNVTHGDKLIKYYAIYFTYMMVNIYDSDRSINMIILYNQ